MKPSLLIVTAAALAFGQESWTPSLSMKMQSVQNVTPSPDGKMAVWTQTRNLMEGDKSEQLTHIFLSRGGNGAALQLTRGDKSAASPRFSPDSQFVYFLSDRSGKMNLYRLAVAGGEAEALTDWKGSMAAFRLSPDGKQAAFTGADENKDEEKRKKEKNDYRVVDEDPKTQSLYVLSTVGTMPATPKRVVTANYHVGNFDWRPDSAAIAFDRRPTQDANDGRKADVSEVELATAKVQDLAAKTETAEANPLYSPDGRYVAYVSQTGEDLAPARFTLLTRSDGTSRVLAPTGNEQPQPMAWAPDSRSIYFQEQQGVRAGIFRIPVDGPPAAAFLAEHGTVAGATFAGGHWGFSYQTPGAPPEAYWMAAGSQKMELLSAANQDVAKAAMPLTELITWKGRDGLQIEGLITYPIGYRRGEPVPTILNIHGGPAGVFSENFVGAPAQYPIASFAAKGYAVLRPNPRGSTGYGQAFRKRVATDWGGLDFQDIMAGVDKLIADKIADPARLAVMGWSYGGFMTAWTVTQTNRFKAAAVGAGVTNMVSMWGTNDIPDFLEDHFGGTPWEQAAVYAKSSPIAFIKNVKTPTLILHGEVDPRVPTSQGYEFYHALKRLGVPAKMVVYPRTAHGPREPKFVLNIMEQHLEWVEKYLK